MMNPLSFKKTKSGAQGLPSTKKNGAGFTLTELLLVISLLLIITSAISGINLLSQQSYRGGEAITEIAQNGRVVLERMVREIRQTKEIITELPEEEIDPSEEIVFQDGHTSSIIEQGLVQGVGTKIIILELDASDQNDYYNNMFVKIIEGVGSGQIREIIDYNGTTKEAQIRSEWDTAPLAGSTYKIDSSYYYIRYFVQGVDIKRQMIVYYFSDNPDVYVSWNAVPPDGQTIENNILQEQLVGEYITNLDFWGLRVINISILLEKNNKKIDLETKIFARNL